MQKEEYFLITGGAGFIGSRLAKNLISEGLKIVIVDNLKSGKKSNIPPGAIYHECDIVNFDFTQLNNLNIKGIYHLAAQSSAEISYEDPEYDLNSNCLSTLKILNYLKTRPEIKLVFASTVSVYGACDQLPLKEHYSLSPKSFYGIGKRSSEDYIKAYAEEYNLKYSILRLFNIYGVGQDLENLRQGMLSIFLAYLLQDKDIHIKGSLERFRDFTNVVDAVEAFKLAYSHKDSQAGIFNVCSGKPITVKDLVDTLLDSYNRISNVQTNKSYFTEGSTPGDQFGFFGSNDKIKSTLGWAPKVSFNEGMDQMVEWAIKQKDYLSWEN